MEGCSSIAFSSPSGIALSGSPSSEVPSRASGLRAGDEKIEGLLQGVER